MARRKKDIAEKYHAPFPLRLRQLMEEKMVNQEMLANETGKTRQTISQYVNGISEPGYDTLVKIANFLNVSTDYLLGRSSIRTPETSVQEMVKQTGIHEDIFLRLIAWNNLDAFQTTSGTDSPEYIREITEVLSFVPNKEAFSDTVKEFINCILGAYLESPSIITRRYQGYLHSLYIWRSALKSIDEHQIFCKADDIDKDIQKYGLITLPADTSAEHCLSSIMEILKDLISDKSENLIWADIDANLELSNEK